MGKLYLTRIQWVVVILLVISVGAYSGSLLWIGDLLSMPIGLFAGLALVLAGIVGYKRQWMWFLVCIGLVSANLYHLVNYPAFTRSSSPSTQPSIRLMVYNIYYQNEDLAGVVQLVQRHDPDIVFLMEYSEAIQQQIEVAFANYPYKLVQPSRFTMGLALFSRVPIESSTIYRQPDTRIPVFQVAFRYQNQSFYFVGGHPWPPQPQWGQLHRNQMMEIIKIAATTPHPLIVAGDFNATPWSYMMQQLSQQARVKLVRDYGDVQQTWHIAPLIGLPIDHVLLSEQWKLRQYQYVEPGGSDHIPIVVDLQL